ncbi:MAG: ribose 5-phosphate isomerase B [Oligoflexales bacterium]|nr:ribose 5-phosphate isomerase B [Oligoflexales bacterium]
MVFKKLGIASDHAGKDLKKTILEFLSEQGLEVIDFGVDCNSTESVDYPDYAAKLAEAVSNQKIDGAIAICGTGIGMCITANKYPSVRACSVWDEYSSRMSREHNDSNCLCLGSRTLNHYRALDIVKIWVETPFGGDRHRSRLDKVTSIEQKNFKTN